MTWATDEALQYLRLAARNRGTCDILRAIPQASGAAIGVHAQPAVEKAPKAVLFFRGVEFRRAHGLEELANMLTDAGEALPCGLDALRWLNPVAVEVRYQDGDLKGIKRDDMVLTGEAVLAWSPVTIGNLSP